MAFLNKRCYEKCQVICFYENKLANNLLKTEKTTKECAIII